MQKFYLLYILEITCSDQNSPVNNYYNQLAICP